MKKIISILIALVLALSLTACGGSGDGEGTANKPSSNKSTLSTYINEATITSQDNISFAFGETDNEVLIVNLNAPELLKGIQSSADSTLFNSNLELRNFGKSHMSSDYSSYFTFKGYGEIKLKVYDASEIKSNNAQVIIDDGSFLLLNKDNNYEVWATDKTNGVLIKADGLNGVKINGEEGFKTFYNTVKEHFTFAKISKNFENNNNFAYTTFNLKKATVFAKGANASDVENWTFANDILYKRLADNGLNLPTSFNMSGSNNYVLAHYDFDDKDTQKNGLIAKFITMSEIDMTFDAPETENAFTVGNYQVVPDGKRTDNYSGGFIVKTSTGVEYHCDISSQEIMEQISYDDAAKYIKTMLGA